jgi:hypothetical protein
MSRRNTTLRRFPEPKLPLERIYIELTNRCNFACEFCPNPVMERPPGQMEFALLEQVLEEVALARVARLVLFHQQGEPTLYARLADAVRAGTRRGLAIAVTTNGSTLNDRLVDALLEAGLARLHISLQTPDEASFRIRGARNLGYAAFEERVARAIRRIVAAEGAPTEVSVAFLTRPFGGWLSLPTIGRDWSIVGTDAGLREILRAWARRALEATPHEPRLAAAEREIGKLGVARWNRLRLAPRLSFETRPVGEWSMPEHHPDAARWVPAAIGTCHGLTDHFAILWNGAYAYCCVDYDGRTTHARFQDVPILDYFDSRPVQRAIRGFRRMRPVHPYCRACLGGPSRAIAIAKGIGSIAYFGAYRRLVREAEV